MQATLQVCNALPAALRSVRFACTDAGQIVRENQTGSNHFPNTEGVGKYPMLLIWLILPRGSARTSEEPKDQRFGTKSVLVNGIMGQRVLVVDDVPDILMLATLSLEAVGFVTLTAHDGQEGVELAASAWPDLILCDVHMPKLDGFELLSAIRSNAATAAIPVVFVSGDQSVCSRMNELPEAPNGFLAKPFTHTDLVRTVTSKMPRS